MTNKKSFWLGIGFSLVLFIIMFNLEGQTFALSLPSPIQLFASFTSGLVLIIISVALIIIFKLQRKSVEKLSVLSFFTGLTSGLTISWIGLLLFVGLFWPS